MVLLSLCHGRIVDQELFEVGFSKSQCVVLRDLSCGYHGFWIPRGGFSTSGRLSVVNAGFERFSVGFREHLIDSDRVQGEVGRAPKVTTRPERRQRARNELRSAGVRKAVQIDELTETVAIAVRAEAELHKVLARKEAQIAKGTIQLQEAEKKIAELKDVNHALRRRLPIN